MNPVTFYALSEPNRFHIVELLRLGPRPVGEISGLLQLNQPQTSKHLKVLADAGIVDFEPIANQRVYHLSPKHFQELDTWLKKYRMLWEQRFDRLDTLLKDKKRKAVRKK